MILSSGVRVDFEDMIADWQSLTDDQQQFAVGVLMSTNPEAFRHAVTFTKDRS